MRRTDSSPPAARSRESGRESENAILAVGRRPLICAAIVFTLLAAWASATTWYLLCKDEVATRFIARQTEMQYAYEEKIGSLRARLDRVASQKLLEQDSLEGRVADLVSRQVQLENRQAVLTGLAEQAGTPALPRNPVTRPPTPLSEDPIAGLTAYAPSQPRPFPAPDSLGLRMREPSAETAPEPRPKPARQSALPIRDRLAGLEHSILRIGVEQARTVDELLRRSQRQLLNLNAAVAELGVAVETTGATGQKGGAGGPFVPLPATLSGPFESQVEQLQKSLVQLDRLRRTTSALPLVRPTAFEAEVTSGFGYRLDPFMRGPALHTGIDFRAEHGAAVRAAGAGRVISAEPNGGYGNMVEIEHGLGVTTRYAHLSSLAVIPGQNVAAGAIVGRVGSTGRSTGAHLHYETRIEGEAVDPQRFLRAGAKLAAANAP